MKPNLSNLSITQLAILVTATSEAINKGITLLDALDRRNYDIQANSEGDFPLIPGLENTDDKQYLVELGGACFYRLTELAKVHTVTKPKTLGYIARETWELFEAGWIQASKGVKNRLEQTQHEKDTEGCVHLLEIALYDSASRGDTTEKVKALSYFKNKSQPADLLGDHILSGFTAVCAIAVICIAGLFASKLSCNGSKSAFCSDVRAVAKYFNNPKN